MASDVSFLLSAGEKRMSCEAPAPNVNATFVRSKTQTLATGLYRLEQATKSYTRNGQGAFIFPPATAKETLQQFAFPSPTRT